MLTDASKTLLELGYGARPVSHNVPITLTPGDALFPAAPGDSGKALNVQVQVEKDVLDLSRVYFANHTQASGTEEQKVILSTTTQLNGATQDGDAKFYQNGSEIVQPSNESANIGQVYTVRIYFKYDNRGEYRLPVSGESQMLPSGYTYGGATEEGFYIEHAFSIVQPSLNDVGVTSYKRTFDGTDSVAFQIYNVPRDPSADIKVTYTGTRPDGTSVSGTLSVGADNNYNGPNTFEAGTYHYVITITSNYPDSPEKVLKTDVIITPLSIKAPTGTNYTYSPGATRTGVTYRGIIDGVTYYTFSDENHTGWTADSNGDATAVNAGDYVVTATLTYPDSTYWADGGTTDNAARNISWSIEPLQVPVPAEATGRTYNGQLQRGVNQPGQNYRLEFADGTATGGTGYYTYGNGQKEAAYTITNARGTNAGSYTATATLASTNYEWASTFDGKIEWAIRPMSVNVEDYVTVSADSVPYDGEAYENTNVHITNKENLPSGLPGQNNLFANPVYSYSTDGNTAPTNAGDYTVTVTYKPDNSNFDVSGSVSARFAISPVKLTMEFEDKTPTPEYTADGTALQLVTVSENDTSLNPALGRDYTITYTYRYRASSTAEWSEPAPVEGNFIPVGDYEITATMSGVGDVKNYIADPATYTLTITQSDKQSIELKSDEGNQGTFENSTYTVTYGQENTFTITGTAALDNAGISYAPAEGSDSGVISVGTDGTVTILKPGNAAATVTAGATPNVDPTSVTYNVKVEKADPGLTVNETALEDQFSYDGQALTKDDIAAIDGAVTFNAPELAEQKPDSSKWTAAFYQYNEATAEGDRTKLESGSTDGLTLVSGPTDVGSYWMLITYPGDDYYTVDYAAAVVTIGQARLEVTVTGYSGTYDGDSHNVADSVVITFGSETLNNDDFTIQFSNQQDGAYTSTLTQKNAGTATYYYKVYGNPNFGEKVGFFTVTITPAELKLSHTGLEITKIYDGNATAEVGSGTVGNVQNGDTISAEVSAAFSDKNAAADKTITVTYTLTADEGVLANYTYGGEPIPKDKTIKVTAKERGTINQKAVTITGITAVGREYDGTTNVDLIGETLTVSGKIDSDVVTVSLVSGAQGTVTGDGAVNVGTNKPVEVNVDADLTIDGADKGNYTYSVPGITVNIAQRQVQLAFPTSMEASYTGQSVAESVYTASFQKNGVEDTVAKGELSAEDIKYTFYNLNSGGTGPEGEALSATPIAEGSYWVTANYTGTNGNFTVAQASGKLTITPAKLNVSATGYSDTYDGGSHDVATLTVTGFVTSDDEDHAVVYIKKTESETSAPAADDGAWTSREVANGQVKNVAESGEYWYRVTADNYAPVVSETPVTVTISRAELTLKPAFSQPSKTYDGDNLVDGNVTGEVTGEKGEENITAAKESATYFSESVAGATGATITYTLSAVTGKLDNYQIEGLVDGKPATIELSNTDNKVTVQVTNTQEGYTGLGITRKPVTVTIPEQTMTYNGTTTFTVPEAITGSFATGDIVGDDGVTATIPVGKTGTAGQEDVTTSTSLTFAAEDVNLTGTDAGNYQVTGQVTGTLEIEKATPTLTFDTDISTGYTGAAIERSQYETAEVAGVSGETGDTVGTITYTIADSAGGPVQPEDLIAAGTYKITAHLQPTSNYNGVDDKTVILTVSASALRVDAKNYTGTYTGSAHAVTGGWTVTGTGGTVAYEVFFASKETYTAQPEADSDAWQKQDFVDVADSGEYWYKVTAASHDPDYGSVTIKIEPAKITLTATVEESRTYNGGTDSTVTTVKDAVYTPGSEVPVNGVTGESFTMTVTAAYTSPDVPKTGNVSVILTYTLEPSSAEEFGNYEFVDANGNALTADGQTTGVYTDTTAAGITPKALDIELTGTKTAVYDGAVPELTDDVITWDVTEQLESQNGVQDAPKITLSLAADAIAARETPYPVTVTVGNPNYELGEVTGNTFTITYRPITVTIGDYATYYGEPLTDLSALLEAELTGENRGLAPDKTIDDLGAIALTTSAGPTVNAGTYPISAADDTYGSYQVTFEGDWQTGTYKDKAGIYTIQKRPITVTITGQTMKYGCDIAAGINSVSGSTVAPDSGYYAVELTTSEGLTGTPMANGDTLSVVLTTTATSTSDVGGDYPITGSATVAKTGGGDGTGNYDIRWVDAAYTIEKADLSIQFTATGTVGIPFTTGYDNQLIFTNASSGKVITDTSVFDGYVTYTMGNASPADFAEVNASTGHVTIAAPGQGRITAAVADTQNYNAPANASYTLLVVQQGAGLTVSFAPQTLVYDGTEQPLLGAVTVRDGNGNKLQDDTDFTIEYRLTKDDGTAIDEDNWSETVPTGDTAGDYTVEYRIQATGYTPIPTPVDVTIEKAALTGGFASDTISLRYEAGKEMDDSEVNLFTPATAAGAAADYDGPINFTSSNPSVAEVENAVEGGYTLTIRNNTTATGAITIYALCEDTDNYEGELFSYQLTISDHVISASAANVDVIYDGQPHAITVNVTDPADPDAYEIRYGVFDGGMIVYDSLTSPEFTDVTNGTYTIGYQVTPKAGYEGYGVFTGTATITITPKSLNAETVEGTLDIKTSGLAATYTYMGGQAIEPPVTVTDTVLDKPLVKDVDYTVVYDNNKEVTTEGGTPATITITGIGNYKDVLNQELTFRIIGVAGEQLWGELSDYFGFANSDEADRTARIVLHHVTGDDSHTVTEGSGNQFDIQVTTLDGEVVPEDAYDVSLTDGQVPSITFHQAGTYTIQVTVSGNHTGEFTWAFTLLPQQNEDGLTLTADSAATQIMTYGETLTEAQRTITVTDPEGNPLTAGADYTLTYVYTPFEGSPESGGYAMEEPLAGTPAAGVYEVTATGINNHKGSTGTFVFLVQKRNLADWADELAVADDANRVYTGSAITVSKDEVTIEEGSLITREDFEIDATGYENNKNAGRRWRYSQPRAITSPALPVCPSPSIPRI